MCKVVILSKLTENNQLYLVKSLVVFRNRCAKIEIYSTVFDNPAYDDIIRKSVSLDPLEISAMLEALS